MRKIFLGLISILIIAGLGWFFFWQKQLPATAPGSQTGETAEKAWVEVENRGVYLVNTDGTLGTELKTGDEVESGQTIMTDNIGLANLHFSDGSVARLEAQTKIDLKDFEYFPGNKTLKVKIFLQSGRVWSRIKALMTTKSYWEVETANAVAAVRGTSFGVVYVPGQTTIIGSVHLINVNAIDPQTKQLIEYNTAYVGEDQYIKINDQDIIGLKDGIKLTSKIRPYNQAIINDPWVIKQKNQDKELEGPTATTTIVRPKVDGEITTKPLDNKTEQILPVTEDEIDSSDEEVVQRPSDDTQNSSNYSGNGQSSVNEPSQDETVENDFYSSVDDPTHGDLAEDLPLTEESPNDYPFGASPDSSVDSDQTSSSEDYVDPTYNSRTSEKTTTTTTTTTIKPTTNLRTINPILVR